MSRSDREGGLQRAADELREKLGRFAGRPRFNKEFETAFDIYFGHGIAELQPALDEADFERFMEWFVYDYPMPNGHRLIEIFDLEHRSGLSVSSRRLLREWMQSHLTVLEVLEETGERWSMADLLTGKRLEGVRVPGEPPPRWSLLVGRPLAVGRGYELSGCFSPLPPAIKETFLQLLRGDYRRYRRENQGATVQHFLREYGHIFNDLIIQLEDRIAEAETSEEWAYRIVHSQAIFDVRDREKVTARLLAFGDIAQVRPGRMIWHDGGTAQQAGRTLAEIHFTNGRMQVHCWSRERLEACKRLLRQRLKGLVRHLVDAYEESAPTPGDHAPVCTLRSGRVAVSQQAPTTGLPGEDGAAQACEEFIENWLRRPQRSLRGASPVQLASSPLGRAHVSELLKQMEYRQRCRFGERGALASRELRRRLQLGEDAGYVVPLGQLPKAWNRDLEVAVVEELRRIGGDELTDLHLDSAIWMWWYYCGYATPVIRKPAAWAAALHSCLALVENWPMTQGEIAKQYGVSPSTLSQNSWRIIDLLCLHVFDDRYSVFHPFARAFGRPLEASADPGPMEDEPLSATLTIANHARGEIARTFEANQSLRQRAYTYFASHVGSRQAAAWEETFLDWYHFDWRVPVNGGRTLVEEALRTGEFTPEDHEVLAGWIGRHPSFYVVKGVERGTGNGRLHTRPRLNLEDLMDESVTAVDWLQLPDPVGPGDILFARLAPVGDATISIGPVLGFPPRFKETFYHALLEDRALVERWNGRPLPWDEYRARYSERLYALALQAVTDGDAGSYED